MLCSRGFTYQYRGLLIMPRPNRIISWEMKTATEKITTTKPQPKIKLNLVPASPKHGDDGDQTNPMKNIYSTNHTPSLEPFQLESRAVTDLGMQRSPNVRKNSNKASYRQPPQLYILRLRANHSLQCPPDFAALGKDAEKYLGRTYSDAAKGSSRQRVTTGFSGQGLLFCPRMPKQCSPGREKVFHLSEAFLSCLPSHSFEQTLRKDYLDCPIRCKLKLRQLLRAAFFWSKYIFPLQSVSICFSFNLFFFFLTSAGTSFPFFSTVILKEI